MHCHTETTAHATCMSVLLFFFCRFKLLSWNIDGLDVKNTVERANAVCSFIKAKLPHAVFLQEVVDSNWAEVVKELGDAYHCFTPGPELKIRYYVAILVHKDTVKVTGEPVTMKFTSTMGRQLFQLPICFTGVNIQLMTSHLESLKESGSVRKEQLKAAFDVMKEVCTGKEPTNCLFGGDLNLRDPEVRSVGIPEGAVDMWEACGSPPSEKYTWDVNVNTNKYWPYPQKPRCRFDRLYFMPAGENEAKLVVPPAPSARGSAKDSRFLLVGKEQLSKCGGQFPSDHWGMWAEFDVQKP